MDVIDNLRSLYSVKEDFDKVAYWSKILENSDPNFQSPSIEPEFLVENYLQNLNK